MNYALFKLPVISSAATKVEWIHQGATERDMGGGILVAELERSYPAEIHGVPPSFKPSRGIASFVFVTRGQTHALFSKASFAKCPLIPVA